MIKPVRHLIGAGTLAVLTVIAVMLAKTQPEFWFSFYTDFSRTAMRVVGAVTGILPICLWEILLVLLVGWFLISFIDSIRKKHVLGWLTGWLEIACLLVFLFVGLWGLNHYAPSLGDQIGLPVGQYTKDQLKQAAAYYAEQAGALSTQVPRDAEGDLDLPAFADLSRAAAGAYDTLGAKQPRFADGVQKVKSLLVSDAFAYMGTTGVFMCYTAEPTVSTSTYATSLPFTMCHELGHSLAVAGEDEANFCAFLACEGSDSLILRYSGYYNAFIYCYNALYKVDATAAKDLWTLCPEPMIHDCSAHVEYNKQYDGAVQEAARAVNDTYLKAFDEAGVQSYGMVADYLIAYHESLAG